MDERRLQQLVLDAKAAHMNMLRVWGGGRYMQGQGQALFSDRRTWL